MSDVDPAPGLTTCPFLVPIVADRLWVYPVGAYCRPSDGRVRVPARQTLARFCTSASYVECDGYRASVLDVPQPGTVGQACHE
jgi:hypothetical protein